MSSNLLITGVGFLCLSWSSVAVAQLPVVEIAKLDQLITPDEQPTQKSMENGQGTLDQGKQPLTNFTTAAVHQLSADSLLAQAIPDLRTLPDLPPGVTEPSIPELPPLPSTPASPDVVPPLQTPQETPAEPTPALGVEIKVQKIEVLGSTVFSSAELDAAVSAFIGQEATFEDLLAIRSVVTDLYTRNGYTTSGAFLPPQDLTEGVVKIQVVEGALERIEIQGLERLRSNYVRSRIALAGKSPVNIRRLEEALQLLQLDPLLSLVQADLTAGTAPGLSVLTLNLQEAPPVSVALLLENRDSPSVGELRGTAVFTHRNLLGFGDRVSAEVGATDGIESYNFNYEIPINARHGTLNVSYSKNNSEIVEEPFAPLDILGDAETFSFGFRQPIVRTPNTEVALSLSADLRSSQTYLLKDIPFSFSEGPEEGLSKVTAIRFAQEWTNRSRTRVLAARSQFSVGINAFDATVNDTGTDGRFFSWVGQFQYVQAFGQGNILIARAGAQLTPDSLLPLEQFSIGGIDTVRGYRQNQRVADNGLVGSVEVRFPIIRDPDGIGIIQVAPFFDIGTVWNRQENVSSPSTLASIGLGLRWEIASEFLARLDWGIPLNNIDNQGDSFQDNGIHFSIRFQPF